MSNTKTASKKVSVNVHIMEKEYQIQCGPSEKQQLIRAAVDVDTRMRSAKSLGLSAEKVAVLTALNLANELQGASDNTDMLETVSDSIIDMKARIEKVLEDRKPDPEQEVIANIQS